MATLAKERSSRALFFTAEMSDDGKAYSPVDYRNHCGLWERRERYAYERFSLAEVLPR